MTLSLIFDLDGTLIDSLPDIHAAMNRVLVARGSAPLSRAQVQGFVGKGAPNLVARCVEAGGDAPDGPVYAEVLAAFLREYEDATGLTTLYPGVAPALEALSRAGYALGLCTNKPLAPTMAILRHLDLARFFPVVIGGDSLPQKKPDPAPLFETQRRMGRADMIFIGDSEVDAATAQAAGVPFLLYTEGYRKGPVDTLPHSASFADFKDLPGLIAQIIAPAAP